MKGDVKHVDVRALVLYILPPNLADSQATMSVWDIPQICPDLRAHMLRSENLMFNSDVRSDARSRV